MLQEKRPDFCLSLHMFAQILSQRTYLKDIYFFFFYQAMEPGVGRRVDIFAPPDTDYVERQSALMESLTDFYLFVFDIGSYTG